MFGANKPATGLFGNTSSSSNTQGSGLFGQKPAQPSGFGASTSSSGGLFGASNTNNNTTQSATSGGLFGSNNTNSGFGSKPAASSGGLFGSNTSTQSSTNPQAGGLFGSNNTAQNNQNSGGLFGSTATNNSNTNSGGLFGSSNNTQNSSTTGGLFGANNASTSSAPGATGGLFGNKTSTSTGGLFGNNNNNNNNTSGTTGGLFGNNNNNNNNTSGTTGGLFGNNNNNTSGTTGGLFGNNNNNNTSGTTGGLFGNNNNNNTSGTTGGLFGNNNSTSGTTGGLFGNNNNNTSGTTGGLFGNNNNNNNNTSGTTGGLFGNNNNNTSSQPSFGWSNGGQQAQGPSQQSIGTSLFQQSANSSSIQAHSYVPSMSDQIVKIKEQWDPESAKCNLKTHFYNKLSEKDAQHLRLYPAQRPANETPEDWDSAMRNRPSAEYFPVKVSSFTEVAQRIEVQIEHVAKARVILNEINEKQKAVSSKHDINNTTRILKAKQKHAVLSRRLLRLATVLAILKLKGYPLLPEEEELSRQFDALNQKLGDPASPLGKLNDIFARIEMLKDRSNELQTRFDNHYQTISDNCNGESGLEDDLVSKLTSLLMKQQVGLNYLNTVLEKDMKLVEQK